MQSITQRENPHAATNELFRVPSAISYSVQKHGRDLDVVLYRKKGVKTVLTQAGKVTFKQVREIIEASEQLVMATKKVRNGYESVFNIAIESVLKLGFNYPLINKFYNLFPDIEINLYEEVLGSRHRVNQ